MWALKLWKVHLLMEFHAKVKRYEFVWVSFYNKKLGDSVRAW